MKIVTKVLLCRKTC